jgi:hypothetical protein
MTLSSSPPTSSPPIDPSHITRSEAFHDLRSGSWAVSFQRKSVGKSKIRTGFRFDFISFR